MTVKYDDELDAVCRQAAVSVSRQFSVERDDMAQDAWLWCVSHPRKVSEYRAEGETGLRHMTIRIRDHLAEMATRELRAATGWEPPLKEDEYRYSVIAIREVLMQSFTEEWWDRGAPAADQPQSRSSAVADPADYWVAVFDVQNGYQKLSQGDRDLLYQVFAEPGKWQDNMKNLTAVYDLTVQGVRDRVNAALRRLRREIGN